MVSQSPAAVCSSEGDDESGGDDQSFESCEPQKDSSGHSPKQHLVREEENPSPFTAAVSAISHMHVDLSNPFHALAVQSAESSPHAAAVSSEACDEAAASVSPTASRSSSDSHSQTPTDADQAASGAKVSDATDAADDVDQGQIFDCFDLKIVYERGRTGFEDTKEIEFSPGMLIAVQYVLLSSNG